MTSAHSQTMPENDPAPPQPEISQSPETPQEPTPMLDVHPAHHAASTWRDFFIHIATIVLGLLIAIGLEQTVEYFHHRHEAREARESIQREAAENIAILRDDVQLLGADLQQLSKDLDLLNSAASDAETLPQLKYAWHHRKAHEAAWDAVRINGSLALIPPARSPRKATSTRAQTTLQQPSSTTSRTSILRQPLWTTPKSPGRSPRPIASSSYLSPHPPWDATNSSLR